MRVFIARDHDKDILGVFSSREAAEQEIKNVMKTANVDWPVLRYAYFYRAHMMRVTEQKFFEIAEMDVV
jgi:hypothetical protein